MSTARRQIRQAAVAALQAYLPTTTVVSPGDWNTAPGKVPEVKVRCGPDRKTPNPTGQAAFTTTVSIEILATVASGVSDSDCQDQLEALADTVEGAILGNPAFMPALVQKFSDVNTQTQITSDGGPHIGRFHMVLSCETFEVFDPVLIDPTRAVDVQQFNLYLDAVNPYDAGSADAYADVSSDVPSPLLVSGGAGAYADNPFTASITTAPRTRGPDGRTEGQMRWTFP